MIYNRRRILLTIDDSESSKHAVDYVAGLVEAMIVLSLIFSCRWACTRGAARV
jgi:hypothetical protein